MAAGLGFKDFTTGEVLTAADVDGYLMQGVWVFASAAARDAAVTSPQEGNFAYLKDTNVTTYYTGSAWANLDTTGMTNPMTTTGDMIYSSSGSTPARLGIGTANQQLRVNAGASAPEWFTPTAASSGLTLIQRSTFTNVANTGSTFDGLFTSTYNAYYVSIENLFGVTSSLSAVHLQLMYSGSTQATDYYSASPYAAYNATTFNNLQSNNTTQWNVVENTGSAIGSGLSGELYFTAVGTGSSTNGVASGVLNDSQGTRAHYFAGTNFQPRAYTGFRFKAASTNITGTIAVYGLAK
jgi:hypothetical protein